MAREYPSLMATIIEVEKLALDLPERDRATLIANLLDSLPPILSDDDEGIAEALRRDAELDADPGLAISAAELDTYIRNRRKLCVWNSTLSPALTFPELWTITKMPADLKSPTNSIQSFGHFCVRQSHLRKVTRFVSAISAV